MNSQDIFPNCSLVEAKMFSIYLGGLKVPVFPGFSGLGLATMLQMHNQSELNHCIISIINQLVQCDVF